MRLPIKVALQIRNSCGKSHNLLRRKPVSWRFSNAAFLRAQALGCGCRCWNLVVISSSSKVIAASIFPATILDFRWKEWSDFSGDGTTENPVPENEGVDTEIVSVSCRWAKLEGGGTNLHPTATHPVRVTKRVRSSRVKPILLWSNKCAEVHLFALNNWL